MFHEKLHDHVKEHDFLYVLPIREWMNIYKGLLIVAGIIQKKKERTTKLKYDLLENPPQPNFRNKFSLYFLFLYKNYTKKDRKKERHKTK